MMTSVSVASDDLRILGHAISWELGGSYEHTPAPSRSEREVEILTRLHSSLCDLNRQSLAGVRPLFVEVGEPHALESGRLRISKEDFRLMIDALASFFGELSCSPWELEVLTGVPSTQTSELLSRLEEIYHQLGSISETQTKSDHSVRVS